MRYSYTKLSTYAQCPQKYKFYCQKAPQEPGQTIPLRFGKAVHAALEFAFNNRLNPPSIPEVIRYYKNLMKLEEDPVAIRRFKEGIPALKHYLTKNSPRKIRPVEVERKFVMKLDRDHDIEGVVDRLDQLPDGSFEILDYKTGSIGDAERLGENWQLAIYQFAKQRKYQTKRIKTSLVYPMFQGHKLTYQFSKKELTQIRRDILDLINDIETAEDFPARKSNLCDTCGYQPICPAFKHKFIYKEKKPKTKKFIDIQEKIDRLLQLRDKAKDIQQETGQIKEILKEFCLKKNLTRLYSDLGTVSLIEAKRVKYDLATLFDNLDPQTLKDIIKVVDRKKLEQILPELPEGVREKINKSKTAEKLYFIVPRPHLTEEKKLELITP